MKIVEGREDDFQFIKELMEYWYKSGEMGFILPQNLARYINDERYYIQKDAGFVIWKTYKRDNMRDGVCLEKIAVKRERQGEGIAQKLLDHLVEKFENTSIKYIKLTVHRDNDRAVKFYTKNGFEINSETERDYEMIRWYKLVDIGDLFE